MAATTTTAYDERHSLLARLREEPLGLSDESLLCVMDGLNRVCDLHPPTQLHWPSAVAATERLEHALEIVGPPRRVPAAGGDAGAAADPRVAAMGAGRPRMTYAAFAEETAQALNDLIPPPHRTTAPSTQWCSPAGTS